MGAAEVMLNKSPIELVAGGGAGVVVVEGAAEKSPKESPKLSSRVVCIGRCTGADVCITGAAAGLGSKKDPPLSSPLDTCLVWVVGAAVAVTGAAPGCAGCGLEDVKESPPNASLMPPKEDCCVVVCGETRVPDDMPAKASMFDCGAACCCGTGEGAGFEA